MTLTARLRRKGAPYIRRPQSRDENPKPFILRGFLKRNHCFFSYFYKRENPTFSVAYTSVQFLQFYLTTYSCLQKLPKYLFILF